MKYVHYMSVLQLHNCLVTMPTDRLTRQAFEMNLSLENNGNWCSDLKEILCTLNKEHTLVTRETINLSYASEIFFEKMNEHFQDRVQNKPKLRSFKLDKANVKTEKYVTANLSRTQRSLMAKKDQVHRV